ncbi:MAG: hypothetical protein ACYDEX_00655, partial [Mobilitalea sp.]
SSDTHNYSMVSGAVDICNNATTILSCGQVQDENPICNQVVTSVSVFNPYQTVNLGQPIDTTVIATFLDGHAWRVSCSNNYNPNVVGQQTVTFTYSGLVGNAKTTGTKTCTAQVTVKDPTILTGITITPVTQSVYRYQSPLFTVTAFYSNGTNKKVLGFTTSGYNSSLLGTQIVTISYSEGAVTKSATATVIVNRISITCPVCGNVYSLDAQDMDNGCPICKGRITKIIATPINMTLLKGNTLPITVEAIYADGHKYTVLSWTSNYNSSALGIQQVTISYLGFSTIIIVEVVSKMKTCSICNRDYALSEDNTDGGCLLCKKEVISINVTEESVSIEKHHPLSINVIGTFRDGHTQIITDWSSNLVADTTGTYDVTVLYQNATDHVIVTVLDEGHIQCPICGLEYVFSDSPNGCPVCSVTVIGIEAALRNGGTTVMYKSQPNLQIVLRYRDTHRQITYTGWTISGYQPDLIGLQTITVHYGVFSTTIDIEIADELPGVICPNGHEYYINEDGSDPGCPYCVQDAEKDNAIFLFENTYTTVILTILYNDGLFNLNKGDYLTVTLTQKDVSIRAKLKNIFFGTNKGIANKKFTFGGEVI